MISKEELHLMLEFTYENPIDEDMAWASFKRFSDHLKQGDPNTLKYFIQVINADHKQLLKLRHKIAENGYELTPDQMSQYVFILAASIVDRINGVDNQENAK